MNNHEDNKYADIINLPYPNILPDGKTAGRGRVRMSMYQRAAQFAPFAALTGHEAAIMETARLTESMIELSEQEKRVLDEKMQILIQHIHDMPSVRIIHFVNDQTKPGGAYVTTEGIVKKWDEYNQQLTLRNGAIIHLGHILDIQGDFL